MSDCFSKWLHLCKVYIHNLNKLDKLVSSEPEVRKSTLKAAPKRHGEAAESLPRVMEKAEKVRRQHKNKQNKPNKQKNPRGRVIDMS